MLCHLVTFHCLSRVLISPDQMKFLFDAAPFPVQRTAEIPTILCLILLISSLSNHRFPVAHSVWTFHASTVSVFFFCFSFFCCCSLTFRTCRLSSSRFVYSVLVIQQRTRTFFYWAISEPECVSTIYIHVFFLLSFSFSKQRHLHFLLLNAPLENRTSDCHKVAGWEVVVGFSCILNLRSLYYG